MKEMGANLDYRLEIYEGYQARQKDGGQALNN